MEIHSWQRIGNQIFVISDASAWWLGDWLIYGQEYYPDRYKTAIAKTSLDYQTLRNYAWVARKFSAARRREKLSFQHHAEVASLSETEQEIWLTRAEQWKWSRNELRRRIRSGIAASDSGSMSTQVRLTLISHKRDQWQKAAEDEGKDLLDWIVNTLDEASEARSSHGA
ncbi:LmbU family transcriptional regulator [Nocardiopsis quinghaiensis]|uniref:LmbU family transcriptional regulator n=1 Tax=Nocardiopsis quinghaiensis TaxID=464995 RepID=UPI0012389ABD